MAKPTKAMIAAVVAIANSASGFAMLTEQEGAAIVQAGLAVVDPNNVEGDKAAVSLTPAGFTLARKNGAEMNNKFNIDDNVPLPTNSSARRGRESSYPFDKLEVGQSFHVAKTEQVPNPAERLASSVSAARDRFAQPTGETKSVVRGVYQRNENGKGFAKDENGNRVKIGEETIERPVKTITRDFVCREVGEDDPKGPGARVWRTA